MPLKKPLNLDVSVPKIDALVLMDSEGKRIAVDYFTANLYVVLWPSFFPGPRCLAASLTPTRPPHDDRH
jgi:hypothetical protein